MAPISLQDQPALDLSKCFSGEEQLVSWETVYTALCDPDTASQSRPLREFLTAEASLQTLSRPWKPFLDASPQEKGNFETATAPINVATSANSHYNIDEIKADSLWLSHLAKISEFAALRLAIIEWQSRPTIQLLSGLTEEEAVSVQEAAGVGNLGSSTFIPNRSVLTAPSSLTSLTDAHFDSEDQRRLRLLTVYLTSRVSILRISQLLISWGCAGHLRDSYGQDYRICDDWLEQLGRNIAAKQKREDPNSPGSEFVDHCIRSIETRLEVLDGGFPWDVPESIESEAAERWSTAQLTEVAHIMHIALVHVEFLTPMFVPASTMQNWFTLMLNRNFFADITALSPTQQTLVSLLQLMVSLLSLALLKVDKVVSDLRTGAYTSWDASDYTINGPVLESITTTFGYAKQLGPSPATPPAFAWSIILWSLTAQANLLDEAREQQADAGREASEPAPVEEAALALARLDAGELFDKKMPFQDLAEVCSGFQVLDLVKNMAIATVSILGTDIDMISRDRCRLLLLHLLRAALGSEIISYSPELIESTHAIITGDKTTSRSPLCATARGPDPVANAFWTDDIILRPNLLDQSRLRYPYETIPLLQFTRALAKGGSIETDGIPSITNFLTQTSTLMQRLPDHFTGFNSIREEENANFVALSEHLPQFVSNYGGSSRRLLAAGSTLNREDDDDAMVIPAGTEGNIVDDRAQPFVALWHYSHSALRYFTRLLSTYTIESDEVEYATQQPVARDTATEIVGLITDLLNASLRHSKAVGDGESCPVELLMAMNMSADQQKDTVSTILAIFEQELLRLCQQPGNEESLELLVSCIDFLVTLVSVAPNRVWPWIARSRLLEAEGNGGSLASILIGTEMVIGHYDFLNGIIRLFDALVHDAVGRAVSRRSSSRALTRFNAVNNSDSGTSDKVVSKVLLTFGRTLASVFEGFSSWKFSCQEDSLAISIGICGTFTTILKLAYGIDDNPQLSSKVTGVVAPVAEFITELYLSHSNNDLPTNPILVALLSGVEPENSSIPTKITALWRKHTRTALSFSCMLVRVAILLNRPWTHLEQQLFKATPLLARLYAMSDSHRSAVLEILESLVRGAVRVTNDLDENSKRNTERKEREEPPSLLGHLGPRTAKNFLSILSQLDEPLKIVDIEAQVWTLLSAVVTCKQQWFALYLLTGNTPREAVRSKQANGSGTTKNKALLTRALDSLSQLDFGKEDLPWSLYTAMLNFVVSAQNSWSWAMGDLRQHKAFISQLLAFFKWLNNTPKNLRSEDGVTTCSFHNKFASLSCEIFAMYLHTARQVGDTTAVKEIVPSLAYLERNALELPGYNVSLHTNLKRNLEEKFRGVTLANFKRTPLHEEHFGRGFFYDIKLADRLLRFDATWSGSSGDQGFSLDVIRANLNLGYVESQVQLLSSWKLLALELGNVVASDERIMNILINVVRDCMVANAESALPEALFGELMTVRADLAFALLQKLVLAKIEKPEARKLLPTVWRAVIASTPDFETAFSNDNVHYYRSLLRILYLSLQFHLLGPKPSEEEVAFRSSLRGSLAVKSSDLTEPISTLLLEILSDTVAKGFRSLANQLHADSQSVSPSDFALLTAILQTILAIPEMLHWQSQGALIFSNNNTVRYATSLFSWADRLTIPSDNASEDPIYGELSLLFILSLSSMRPLAETMAVEGILSTLNTANLMNYYRRPGGMSPFEVPHRVFSIWTKGILPLCLNLLSAVGPPIAAEISSFLNLFPAQLSRASNALNSRTMAKITLSLASETHSLALISAILDQNRAHGPRLGIQASEIPALEWDRENVKEDVESWLARKAALRERIVVVDEGEAVLLARRAGAANESNELEERVVRELEAAAECLAAGRGSANGGSA